MDYDLRRYEHPGKFEGGLVIDELAYIISLDGGCESISLSEWAVDCYTRVDGPITAHDVRGVLRDNPDLFLTEDERKFLVHTAGAIVHEDNNGFVTVDWFDTKKELEEDWTVLEVFAQEMLDEEENDDE